MNKMVKDIALRVVLLIIIVVASNYVYIATTYESDVSSDGNVLNKFEEAIEEANVLYFSASPNGAVHWEDQDQRHISQMLDDQLDELSVASVDTGAIHAGVFKELIRMIPDDSPVSHVVVHMNYRSFGMGWIESKLENSIQKQMVFYNNRPPIVNRFLQGLNWYDAYPENERKIRMLNAWENDQLPFDPPRNTVTSWCEVEKWGDWTNPKRQLADHYIKNFAFVLDEENPRISDFDEIVDLCKTKNLALTFVILPENLDEAEILVGSELTNLMKDNKDFLMDRYSAEVDVIDLFDHVPDSVFIEREFPSEHYREAGRQRIATSISEKIK